MAVAFDPSPVNGYSTSVTNEQVNCSTRVVRIHERGEALQSVRSTLRRFYPLSSNISELSFDVIHAHGSAVANHSIAGLIIRRGLEERAKVGPTQAVPVTELPGKPDCDCYRKRRPLDESKDAGMCRAADAAVH